MKRVGMLFIFTALLAGCRNGPPSGDPFLLGRTTIPPPGTGSIGNGAQANLAPSASTTAQAAPASSTFSNNQSTNLAPITPRATAPTTPATPVSQPAWTPPATTAPAGAPPANNPYTPRDGSFNFRQGSTIPDAGGLKPVDQPPDLIPAGTTQAETAVAAGAKTNPFAPSGNVAPAAAPATASESSAGATVVKNVAAKVAIPGAEIELEPAESKDSAKPASTVELRTSRPSVIRIVEPKPQEGASAAPPTDSLAGSSQAWQPQWGASSASK